MKDAYANHPIEKVGRRPAGDDALAQEKRHGPERPGAKKARRRALTSCMRIVREGWPFILGCLIAAIVFLSGAIDAHSVVLTAHRAGPAFCDRVLRLLFPGSGARHSGGRTAGFFPPPTAGFWRSWKGKDADHVPEPVWIVRIFLSVFEPHLQRSPVAGRVQAIQYKKGKFLDARDPKAPFENEQNRIEIVSGVRYQPRGWW